MKMGSNIKISELTGDLAGQEAGPEEENRRRDRPDGRGVLRGGVEGDYVPETPTGDDPVRQRRPLTLAAAPFCRHPEPARRSSFFPSRWRRFNSRNQAPHRSWFRYSLHVTRALPSW